MMSRTPQVTAGGDALGVLEIGFIARGVWVADAMVKKAPITVLWSAPVSGGKHLIFLRSGVAEIEEAMQTGIDLAGDALIDSLELAMPDEQLWPLLPTSRFDTTWATDGEAESLAIVETATVCAALGAADAAAKAAAVTLRDMHLAVGIAGKAYFSMTGRLHDIQAATDAAREVADQRLLCAEVIAQPDVDIRGSALIKP